MSSDILQLDPLSLWKRGCYQLHSLGLLGLSVWATTQGRLWRGPARPSWTGLFEMTRTYSWLRTETALALGPAEGRKYLDSLSLPSPVFTQVRIEKAHGPAAGEWFLPSDQVPSRAILYLHGGGYAFYTKAQRDFVGRLAIATRARTFALDYRLTPEHPFPAQLEDATGAYRWFLDSGIAPGAIVVVGDSAGGNLTLALLLALRQAGEPLPGLAVCLSPWVDVTNRGESMRENAGFDWITGGMANQWARWLCQGNDPQSALVSPLYADLAGLPPIYIQAGGAEILRDAIRSFVERARADKVDVTFEEWPDMVHVFQTFGDVQPAGLEALRRIGTVVDRYVPAARGGRGEDPDPTLGR